MDIRLTLKPEQEKPVEDVANAQAVSGREAVINVFMRHYKTYSKKRIQGFSKTKMGRPKSSPSKAAK